MKRSEINRIIAGGLEFLSEMQIFLPPFFYWPAEAWAEKGHEYDEIRDCMLGWDVTDYGLNDFDKTGLLALTIRNGTADSAVYAKMYAEKLLVVQENQETPLHFHYRKMEDIINRGGGNLMIQLYNSDGSGGLAYTPVEIQTDGKRYAIGPGDVVSLKPGESITCLPHVYHRFWAEKAKTVLGEVSKVNDDKTDNRFFAAPARYSQIEEDAAPEFLLCGEYPPAGGS